MVFKPLHSYYTLHFFRLLLVFTKLQTILKKQSGPDGIWASRTLDLTPHKFDVKPKSSNQIKVNMAPMGFEPTTPGLKVQCSSQAELRSHISEKDVNTL